MRLWHDDTEGKWRRHVGHQHERLFAGRDPFSTRIEHARHEFQRLIPSRAIGNLRLDVDRRLALRHTGLQPGHARRAVIGQREILFARFDEVDRPIQSAENAEITAQRRDVRFGGVADADGEQVGSVARQAASDFVAERAERAAMLSQEFAVQINIRHRTRCFEFQEIALAVLRLNDELAPVPTRSAIIILSLLRILPAPTVGNRNRFPIGLVEIRFCAGRVSLNRQSASRRVLPGRTNRT